LNHVVRSLAVGGGIGGLLIHDFNQLAHRAAKASVTFTGAIHGTSLGVSLSTVTFTRPRSRERGTYAMSSGLRTEAERLVAAQ